MYIFRDTIPYIGVKTIKKSKEMILKSQNGDYFWDLGWGLPGGGVPGLLLVLQCLPSQFLSACISGFSPACV